MTIARLWQGLARAERADEYERHLRAETFPALHKIRGFRNASILRRDVERGVEFIVVTQWASLDAIKAFAGDDTEIAVVPPAVQAMMVEYDQRAKHYEDSGWSLDAEITRTVMSHGSRLAGAVLGAGGLGLLGVLLAFIMETARKGGPMHPELLLFMATLLVVGAFCVVVGSRLLRMRPNKEGSSLSPTAWLVLSAIFGMVAIALVALVFMTPWKAESLMVLVSAPALFVMVALRAWQVRRRDS